MLKSALKFARLRIVATCYGLVFLGSASAGSITIKTIFALILIILVTIHANSINDYADRDIDSVNLKDANDRPLVTKDISLNKFWIIHFASGAVALALSFFYEPAVVLLSLAVIAIDYAYSLKPFRLAYRPIISPLLLSVSYVFYSFSLGYFSVSTTKEYPWLLSIGLCFGFVARMLLKDFRDAKGDKRYGKVTFLLQYGITSTCLASAIFWLLAIVIVSSVTSFAVGTTLPLGIGLLSVFVMLFDLSITTGINKQQDILGYIAKSANFSIITILAYLLCQNQADLSSQEQQIIPACIGISLIVSNWLIYSSRKHAA
jgi:4-hydroxybenzoate polyprenyltransferase